MGPCLKQQQVGYIHTLPTSDTDNPSPGVAFWSASLIYRWLDHAREGRKGGQVIYAIFVTRTSTISHRLSYHCGLFLSSLPQSQNTLALPPPPFPTAYIMSIVSPYLHSPPAATKSAPTRMWQNCHDTFSLNKLNFILNNFHYLEFNLLFRHFEFVAVEKTIFPWYAT